MYEHNFGSSFVMTTYLREIMYVINEKVQLNQEKWAMFRTLHFNQN